LTVFSFAETEFSEREFHLSAATHRQQIIDLPLLKVPARKVKDNFIIFFQGLISSQWVYAQPTFGLALLLELIAVGDFGGGEVVYTGTASSGGVTRYKSYTPYRPTQRSRWRPPGGQRHYP
jgi:hypothetical protein